MDLSKIPSMMPPPGAVVDFNSPENHAVLYIATCSVLVPLTALFVTAKLCMRIFVVRKLAWDDFLDRGAGRHMWDIPVSLALEGEKVINILVIIQQPTLLATKLALLGLYYQLFAPKPAMRYTIIVGIVTCSIIYISFMIIWITIRNHLAEIVMVDRIKLAQSILNLATDVYIFVVPLIAISGLKMSRSQKIGVTAVFLTGSLAVASCITSIVFRFGPVSTSRDAFWQLVPFYLVLTTEISVGLMCGSMPVFPALMRRTGLTKWCSSAYTLLISRFTTSTNGTSISVKNPVTNGFKSNSKGEDSLPLQEKRHMQEHIYIDVGSMRNESLSGYSGSVGSNLSNC
ncbi:hypothetical protein OIDMADRAFT_146316 [Oidiodendron maius Zn]|uniref:Rhodopsin domain-containing protein n=1 Tax=Oidiodendron maius (strain Zn) TaxID=913774 RepID=A0A0C3HBI1_OIDMZ|nr:hypothetical protein OIDMADRAFT_146316 [Oidiodendron maius Zn]